MIIMNLQGFSKDEIMLVIPQKDIHTPFNSILQQ